MSGRYLVVDGHSVIFSWTDLRGLHQRNRAAARKALADRLQVLHDSTSWRVTLVLDGTHGTAQPAPRHPQDMITVYATADQTADSIIERLVASSGEAARVTVITADEVERRLVESLGAATASPAWLREEMAREGAEFQGRLDQVHRSAKWGRR
jgi:predicted RNA-binding protein with PIN domain